MLQCTAPLKTGALVDRVLVVDDDPVVYKAMSVLMAKAGFSPIVCGNAQEALSLAAAAPISAAVVDIHLPDMNGLDLSHELRSRLGPTVPIVVLSGDNSIETLLALPGAGATHFFAKPVNAGMLIDRLKEWIAEPPTAGGGAAGAGE